MFTVELEKRHPGVDGVGAMSVMKDQGIANTRGSQTGCSNRTWAAQRCWSIDI